MLRESGQTGAGLPRGTLAWLLAVTPATSSAGVNLESWVAAGAGLTGGSAAVLCHILGQFSRPQDLS